MELKEHEKTEIVDKEFTSDACDEDFSLQRLTRVYAVERIFRNSSFSRCVLDDCYFRKCRFINCDFTGVKISNSNFRGAQFTSCNFRYSEWHRTILEDRFLDTCLPSEDNLARDVVRSLRVNFTEIGNYEAVNKASSIEVKLTGRHLYDAAFSGKSYYRRKDGYEGTNRIKFGALFIKWKFLDLLWGNGESLIKVFACATILVVAATFFHFDYPDKPALFAFLEVFDELWGIANGQQPSRAISISLAVGRFVFFGLFMAILVKRLSRR